MPVIAGIGSRETPESIKAEMTLVGRWCLENGVWLRSGHAPGADQAFEKGALNYCIAYIPWPGFCKNPTPGVHYRVPNNLQPLYLHAAKHHPRWGGMSEGVQCIMARNSAQVMGERLDSPVQAIVCWTKDWQVPSGGTAQALRIAEANKIPIINMCREIYCTAPQVIQRLWELLDKPA